MTHFPLECYDWCWWLFLCISFMFWAIWAATRQNQQSDCAPSEDSDQAGHPPSLIRVFAVRMKKAWVLSYPLSAPSLIWVFAIRMKKAWVLSYPLGAQRRVWSDWTDDQNWVFAGLTVTMLVLSCRGSFRLFTRLEFEDDIEYRHNCACLYIHMRFSYWE